MEIGEDVAQACHLGVKASNAKGKRNATNSAIVEGEGKSLSEFQSMWEIKQHDFALKEKLNKPKLLDSLLAKTEPLSEIEKTLKNKLIIKAN